MNRNRIAIIPARAGSKRIPRKNIMDFFGKPMVAWSIEAALESGQFNRVVVSTEDEEIADLCRRYGAEVPFLREGAFDDAATSQAASIHGLRQAEEYWGEAYDTVASIQPNCPLRTADDISRSIKSFDQHESGFQISCFKFGWMNPWWAAEVGDAKEPAYKFSGSITQRSQDLPDLFCPTGAIFIGDAAKVKEGGTFYGEGHRFEPLHWTSAVDIDTYDDLEMAKAVKMMRDSLD